MKLETKYSRNDTVFVLHKNEVVEANIASVMVTLDTISGKQSNRYILSVNNTYSTYLSNAKGNAKKFPEWKLYPTKAQLLKSL